MPSFISFIPTRPDYVDAFFELAPVSSSDIVYDLGSGDGRLLIAALERGARKAIGVEMDTECIRTARDNVKRSKLTDRVTFIEADVMDVNLSDANLVFCYLSVKASETLKPKLEAELKTGTRVVSEMFPIPGWQPVRTTSRGLNHDYFGYVEFFLYVMPPAHTD